LQLLYSPISAHEMESAQRPGDVVQSGHVSWSAITVSQGMQAGKQALTPTLPFE
jgi:hypothetical protein